MTRSFIKKIAGNPAASRTRSAVKPEVIAAGATAALAGLGMLLTAKPVQRSSNAALAVEAAKAIPASQCPPKSLPDRGVCIPVPETEPAAGAQLDPTEARIPRRPDRPADYAAYDYPVDLEGRGSNVHTRLSELTTGALPDSVASALGGIVLAARHGAPVEAPRLEGQLGPSTVIHVGDLIGPTLVTRHRVGSEKSSRSYVVILGNLEKTPDVEEGVALESKHTVGRPSSALTPKMTSAYLEIRLLRPDFDAADAPVEALLDPANTIVVDSRNVMPLRASAR